MLLGTFFMTSTPKRPRDVQIYVELRVKSGLCLCKGCDNPEHSRGRCEHHFFKYYNRRRSMDPKKAFDFEIELITDGTLLVAQEKRLYKADDPDAAAARRAG